ncbi:hypothetical protein [Oscillatoria salina]|uniref:hypothetical protein n=1 Tax=Oscillatoria salina TaxID=331517 RepID=UPI0013BCC45C|nr:hypothetical protein [Oscillatoria salina]MBZ8181557.1 hypothetical protein [Oscillatoria salina IIICB1]NET91578.1 hypothetical protein [Kamptonema sp. SIO1D9]
MKENLPKLLKWLLRISPQVRLIIFISLLTLGIMCFLVLLQPSAKQFNLLSLIYFVVVVFGFFLLLTIANYENYTSVFAEDYTPHPITERKARKFKRGFTQLASIITEIEQLGFREIDRFSLQKSYYFIVTILRHPEKAIDWYLIYVPSLISAVYPQKIFSELSTVFASNLLLKTVSFDAVHTPTVSFDAIHTPKPNNFYYQALMSDNYSTFASFLETHEDAVEIFRQCGHFPQKIPVDSLRDRFVERERYLSSYVMSFPFWAIKINFWILFKAGKKYCQTIRNELKLEIIEIPENE